MDQVNNLIALKLGDFVGFGPLGGEDKSNPGQSTLTGEGAGALAFTNFISTAIGVMTIVAFIWFIIQLFIGAIGWLASGGDKAKLQEAQKKITTSVIGLTIVISAIFLIKIIGSIFGIDFLNLTELITNL